MAYGKLKVTRKRSAFGRPRSSNTVKAHSRCDEKNSSFGGSEHWDRSSSAPSPLPHLPFLSSEEEFWLRGIKPHSAMAEWFQSIKEQLHRRLQQVTTGKRSLPPFRRPGRSASARRHYHNAAVLRTAQRRDPESVVVRAGGIAFYKPLEIPAHVWRHYKGKERRRLKVYRPSRYPWCSVRHCPRLSSSPRGVPQEGVDSLQLPSTPSPRGHRRTDRSSLLRGKEDFLPIQRGEPTVGSRRSSSSDKILEEKEKNEEEVEERQYSGMDEDNSISHPRRKGKKKKRGVHSNFLISTDILGWGAADEKLGPLLEKGSGRKPASLSRVPTTTPPSGATAGMKLPRTLYRKGKRGQKARKPQEDASPRIIIPPDPFQNEKASYNIQPYNIGLKAGEAEGGIGEKGKKRKENKITNSFELKNTEKKIEESSESSSDSKEMASPSDAHRDDLPFGASHDARGVKHSVDVPPWWESGKRRRTRVKDRNDEQGYNDTHDTEVRGGGGEGSSDDVRSSSALPVTSTTTKNSASSVTRKRRDEKAMNSQRSPPIGGSNDLHNSPENSINRRESVSSRDQKRYFLPKQQEAKEKRTQVREKKEWEQRRSRSSSLRSSREGGYERDRRMTGEDYVNGEDVEEERITRGRKRVGKKEDTAVNEVLRRLELGSSEDFSSRSDFLNSLLSSGTLSTDSASSLKKNVGRSSTRTLPPSHTKDRNGREYSRFRNAGGGGGFEKGEDSEEKDRDEVGDRDGHTERQTSERRGDPRTERFHRHKPFSPDSRNRKDAGDGPHKVLERGGKMTGRTFASSFPFPSSSFHPSPLRANKRPNGEVEDPSLPRQATAIHDTSMEHRLLPPSPKRGRRQERGRGPRGPSSVLLEEDTIFTKPVGDYKRSGMHEWHRLNQNRRSSYRSYSAEVPSSSPSAFPSFLPPMMREGSEAEVESAIERQLRNLKRAIQMGSTTVAKEREEEAKRGLDGGERKRRGGRLSLRGRGVDSRKNAWEVEERSREKKNTKRDESKNEIDFLVHPSRGRGREGREKGGGGPAGWIEHPPPRRGRSGEEDGSFTVVLPVLSEENAKVLPQRPVKVLSLSGGVVEWERKREPPSTARSAEGTTDEQDDQRGGGRKDSIHIKGTGTSQPSPLRLLPPVPTNLSNGIRLPAHNSTLHSAQHENEKRRGNPKRRSREREDNDAIHRDSSIDDKWSKLPVLGSQQQFSGSMKRSHSRSSFRT